MAGAPKVAPADASWPDRWLANSFGTAQFSRYRFRDRINVRALRMLRLREFSDDLTLPRAKHATMIAEL